MKTHVILVSNQAAANLLPVFDATLKPQHVLMLVTSRMHKEAEWLKQVLSQASIKVDPQIALPDETDFSKTEETIVNALVGLQDRQEVYINITGGTKLMALAAKSAADAADRKCFYVDLDSDQVIWLPFKKEPIAPPLQLDEQLRMKHYFMGYGLETKHEINGGNTEAHQRIVKSLLLEIDRYEPALKMLNGVGLRADRSKSLRVRLEHNETDSKVFGDIAMLFSREGFLKIEGDTLTYTDDRARSFASGGWLESHAFECVNDLRQSLRIRDVASNLEVTKDLVKNEFDVVFLRGNRPYIIECKTSRMDWNDGEKANEALFKLRENARRIGGLGAKAMLVTYRKLMDAELKLAKALDIRVVAGADIARLKENIRSWVQ